MCLSLGCIESSDLHHLIILSNIEEVRKHLSLALWYVIDASAFGGAGAFFDQIHGLHVAGAVATLHPDAAPLYLDRCTTVGASGSATATDALAHLEHPDRLASVAVVVVSALSYAFASR